MRVKKFLFVSIVALSLAMLASGGLHLASATPGLDQGCYCHNDGIGVWLNGTGFNEYGGVTVQPGGAFVLNATSENIAATGVVPGIQQWLTNITDNAKFTFSPQSVSDSSPQNLKHQTGNITAIYTITAPATAGNYMLGLYAQGTTVNFMVQVGSPSSNTTSTTGSSATSTGGSTTSQSQTSNGTTSQSSTQTSSGSGTTTTKASGPSVLYYSSELAVLVVGFSLFVVSALWRYGKS